MTTPTLMDLHVRVRVDCIYVDESTPCVGPAVTLAELEQGKWIPSRALRRPMQSGGQLEKGVHLHWLLPEYLLTAKPQGNDPSSTARAGMKFPPVPNRWLVYRYGHQRTRVWLVLSDYFSAERLGYVHELKEEDVKSMLKDGRTWVPDGVLASCLAPKGPLTAEHESDPLFATFYPASRNVFGLYDKDGSPKDIYDVQGWYSDESHDAVAQWSKRQGWQDAAGRPDHEAVKALAKELGLPRKVHLSEQWIGFQGTSPSRNDRGLLATWFDGEATTPREAQHSLPKGGAVFLGASPSEAAASCVAAQQSATSGAPLDKARLADGGGHSASDHRISERHQAKSFRPVVVGHRYVLQPAKPEPMLPGSERGSERRAPPEGLVRSLDTLNTDAAALAAVEHQIALRRRQLMEEWNAHLAELDGTSLGTALPEDVGKTRTAIVELMKTADSCRKKLEDGREELKGQLKLHGDQWVLKDAPAERFWTPIDPTVVCAPLLPQSSGVREEGASQEEGWQILDDLDWRDPDTWEGPDSREREAVLAQWEVSYAVSQEAEEPAAAITQDWTLEDGGAELVRTGSAPAETNTVTLQGESHVHHNSGQPIPDLGGQSLGDEALVFQLVGLHEQMRGRSRGYHKLPLWREEPPESSQGVADLRKAMGSSLERFRGWERSDQDRHPIRAGSLTLERLRLVNRFGLFVDIGRDELVDFVRIRDPKTSRPLYTTSETLEIGEESSPLLIGNPPGPGDDIFEYCRYVDADHEYKHPIQSLLWTGLRHYPSRRWVRNTMERFSYSSRYHDDCGPTGELVAAHLPTPPGRRFPREATKIWFNLQTEEYSTYPAHLYTKGFGLKEGIHNGLFDILRKRWDKWWQTDRFELRPPERGETVPDLGGIYGDRYDHSSSRWSIERLATTSPALELPPRFLHPLRLHFRWMDAARPTQELNSHTESNPICGFLLARSFDDTHRIDVYDAAGTLLGWMEREENWTSWPDHSRFEGVPEEVDIAPMLKAVVNQLSDNHEFDEVWASLNKALHSIVPGHRPDDDLHAFLAGHPLALVCARVGFETTARLSRPEAEPERPDWMKVEIPIRLGEHERESDGVVAFWEATESADGATIHLEHTQLPSMRMSEKAEAAHGIVHVEIQDNVDAMKRVVMLVDPHATVCATSGVVPVKTLRLPPDDVSRALAKLKVVVEVGEVLTRQLVPEGNGPLELPQPSIPGWKWSWLDQLPDSPSEPQAAPEPVELRPPMFHWRASQAGSAGAAPPDQEEPLVVREGWLIGEPS